MLMRFPRNFLYKSWGAEHCFPKIILPRVVCKTKLSNEQREERFSELCNDCLVWRWVYKMSWTSAALILSSLPGRSLCVPPAWAPAWSKTKLPAWDGIRCGESWIAGPRMEIWATHSSAPSPADGNVTPRAQPKLPKLQLEVVALHCLWREVWLSYLTFSVRALLLTFFFCYSHSISSSFHTPPPGISEGCDTAEGSDDPVPTADLMWIINK